MGKRKATSSSEAAGAASASAANASSSGSGRTKKEKELDAKIYKNLEISELAWSSLTVQYHPDGKHVLTATNAEGHETEFVHLMGLSGGGKLREDKKAKPSALDEIKGCIVEQNNLSPNLHIKWSLVEATASNRARFNHNAEFVASRNTTDFVNVWRVSADTPRIPTTAAPSPLLRLEGLKNEGVALDWNPRTSVRQVASGDSEGLVAIWDVQAGRTNPMWTANAVPAKGSKGSSSVLSCSWSGLSAPSEELLTGCEGGLAMLFDPRAGEKPLTATITVENRNRMSTDVNSVAFHPNDPSAFLTGGASVQMWDRRQLDRAIECSFSHHTKPVFAVAWSPLVNTSFASAGEDRHVVVWDTRSISDRGGETLMQSHLVFMHEKHENSVSDLAFSPTNPWELCSVDQSNKLHRYTIGPEIINAFQRLL